MTLGDFNGDGHLDLAVAHQGESGVSVLLGNGDGSFQAPLTFGVGIAPTSVAVGDFNADGKQDLAVANSSSGDVSVLINNTSRPPCHDHWMSQSSVSTEILAIHRRRSYFIMMTTDGRGT